MTRSWPHLPNPSCPAASRAPRLLAVALAAATMFGGCVTRPRHDEKGLLPTVRWILAAESGTRATGKRLGKLADTPARLRSELTRIARLPDATAAASSELRRPHGLLMQVQELGWQEVRRRQSFDFGVLPRRHEFAQNLADDLDHALHLLGTGPRPLGEIDDRTHRTDHRDQSPERSLWYRLKRRLPF